MNKSILRLYLIASSSSFKNPLTDLETAFKSGVTCFQLREKGENIKSGEDLINFAKEAKDLCLKYKVTFIINDDVELARMVDADGVHVGQDDTHPKDLPSFLNNKIIGLSVGNLEELKHSDLNRVDYLGCGPVFPTSSKDDAGQAISLTGLNEISEHTNLPVVAIGGITIDNFRSCLMNGADGISVISAITQSANIEQTVTQLLS